MQSDRRHFRRAELACPISLHDGKGHVLAKAKSSNISNGGMFLAVPLEVIEKIGSELNLAFSVPRQTTNSYMLEEFACRGQVLRREPMDTKTMGLAIAFPRPMPVVIEA